MRRNDLDSFVPKSRCNGSCRFGPAPNRIFAVPIRRIAVPHVHPRLIAHRPRNACPIPGKLALDFHVSFGIHVRMVAIDDVDIAPSGERLAGVCGQGSLRSRLGRVKGRCLAAGDERGALRATEQFPADLGWESSHGWQVESHQFVAIDEPAFGAIGRPEFGIGLPASGRLLAKSA
jgi:hypothetical protein